MEALRQPHQNLRDITSAPIDPRIETLGLRGSPNYPSSASALQSPGFDEIAGGLGSSFDRSNTPSSSLLPPFSSISAADSPSAQSGNSDFYEPVEHHAKRMRLSTGNEPSAIPHFAPTPEDSIAFGYDTNLLQPGANISFNFAPTPLTPGTGMDEIVLASVPQQPQPAQSQAPDQPRKLSVNDLLSAPPPDDMLTPQTPDSWPTHDVDTTAYGYDLGRPDEDIPNNNDVEAIRVMGSPEARRLPYPASGFFADDGEDDDESKDRPIAFNRGGYYVKPVAIRIPKALEPLPNKLLESPMNLLYFHHFLNHTARILVPHDCEQNPFRNVLPQCKLNTFTMERPEMLTMVQWPYRMKISSTSCSPTPPLIVRASSSIPNPPTASLNTCKTSFPSSAKPSPRPPSRYPPRTSPAPSCSPASRS